MKITKMKGRRGCSECLSKNPDKEFSQDVWAITIGEKKVTQLCAEHVALLGNKLIIRLLNFSRRGR